MLEFIADKNRKAVLIMDQDKVEIIKLVKLFQKGDKTVFEKIYTILYEKILSYCFFIVKDYHTAEEITNTVFIKVHKKIDKVDPLKFLPYIYKASRNECLNHLQCAQSVNSKNVSYLHDKTKDGYEVIHFIPSKTRNPSRDNMINEEIELIKDEIKTLSPKQQMVMNMMFEGKKISENRKHPQSSLRVSKLRALLNLKRKPKVKEMLNNIFYMDKN